MDRRDFLKAGTAAALIAQAPEMSGAPAGIPKRTLGKTGEKLSIIGFPGTALMDVDQAFANNLVAEAVDHGINYFDVAPSYGIAQQRLGPAFEPYRKRCFLACKTEKRDKAGVEAQLNESLKLLRTDHVDLYQHHALTKTEELDQVFGPNGAMEAFVAAQKAGKIRFLGFSAHSVETAIAAMDRAHFDTILFPTNFVLFTKANFGPQVLEHARKKGMGYLAIKAMAKGKYAPNLPKSKRTDKCWYQPCDLPEQASLALRWTLSQPVTAAMPPGNPAWFRQALQIAGTFQPISSDESKTLIASATGAEPIFELGNNV